LLYLSDIECVKIILKQSDDSC